MKTFNPSEFAQLLKKAIMSSTRAKIGGAMLKPALKEALTEFDSSKFGGAPMLGLKGLVVKTHGNAKATEICNAVLQCKTFHEENISGLIAKELNGGN